MIKRYYVGGTITIFLTTLNVGKMIYFNFTDKDLRPTVVK